MLGLLVIHKTDGSLCEKLVGPQRLKLADQHSYNPVHIASYPTDT